jgi:hypothetical protein
MTVAQSVIQGRTEQRDNEDALRRIVFAVLIGAIVLSPNFTIVPGLYKPRIEDVILLAVAVVWFLKLPSKRLSTEPLFDSSHSSLVVTRILMGMFLMAFVSIGVGTIFFRQPLVLNDWVALPMIARYWLIFQVGQWVREGMTRRVLLWALLISLGIAALVGILQHFNLFAINDWLTPQYVADHMEVVGLELVKRGAPGGRVVGTHGDPRYYAYMLAFGTGLCASVLLSLKNRTLQGIALTVLGLCLMATAFTASRTTVLSTAVVFLSSILIQRRGITGASKLILLAVVLLAGVALVFPAVEFQTFEERITDWDRSSYHARIRDLKQPFLHALDNPLIWLTGRGPAKAVMRTSSHNDFGWYFHRFGLPGLFLYVLLILSGIKMGWYGGKSVADASSRTVCMATFLLMLNWFVFAMANATFKDPQLMALNMLLLGACVGVNQEQQGY